MNSFSLLTALIPLVGAFFVRSSNAATARPLAIVVALLSLLAASIGLFMPTLAAALPALGLIGGGLDRVAAMLSPAFATLLVIVVGISPKRVRTPATLSRILASAAASLALVAAVEPGVLAVVWALAYLPVFLELRAANEHGAARIFAIHGVVSALALALGLGFIAGGRPNVGMPLVMVAVMVREGLLPFHTWLPALYDRAPLATTAMWVAPQAGVVVLVRFVSFHGTEFADAALATLGLVTALHGAALALVQRRPRRALAYLAVSQSALIIAGIPDGGLGGRTGGLLLIFSLGAASAGIALALQALEARRDRRTLDGLSGGFAKMPMLASAMLVLGLCGVGLPGTLGYVAEDLVLHALIDRHPIEGIALVVATALNGVTVLKLFFRLFGGPTPERGLADLNIRERIGLWGMVTILLLGGVLPSAWLSKASAAAAATAPQQASVYWVPGVVEVAARGTWMRVGTTGGASQSATMLRGELAATTMVVPRHLKLQLRGMSTATEGSSSFSVGNGAGLLQERSSSRPVRGAAASIGRANSSAPFCDKGFVRAVGSPGG